MATALVFSSFASADAKTVKPKKHPVCKVHVTKKPLGKKALAKKAAQPCRVKKPKPTVTPTVAPTVIPLPTPEA